MSTTWFTQGQKIGEYKPEPRKGKVSNGYPFSLKKGETAKIAILNPDDDPPPVLHAYTVPDPDPNVKKFYLVVSALADGAEVDHWHEYAKTVPEGIRWRWKMKKYACYSILDLREQKSDDGKVYPPQRKLRLTQEPQLENLRSKYDIIQRDLDNPTLQFSILVVKRSMDEKSAGVGEIEQVLKMLDTSAYSEELLTPMTPEEIMSYFVVPGTPEYERLVEAYPIKDVVSKEVKKNKK